MPGEDQLELLAWDGGEMSLYLEAGTNGCGPNRSKAEVRPVAVRA